MSDIKNTDSAIYSLLIKRRELKRQLRTMIENRKPEDVITVQRRTFGFDKKTLEYTQQLIWVETTKEEEVLRAEIERLKMDLNNPKGIDYKPEEYHRLRDQVVAMWRKRNAEGITENLIEVNHPGLAIMANGSIVFSSETRWSTEEEEEILLVLQVMESGQDIRQSPGTDAVSQEVLHNSLYGAMRSDDFRGVRRAEVVVHGAPTLTSQCRTAQSNGRLPGSGEALFTTIAKVLGEARKPRKPTLMDNLIKRRLEKN